MQVRQASHSVDKTFNSVSRTSKSVRMTPIELFAHLTVFMKDLQRRRANCFVPPTMPNSSTIPRPPQDHSCGSRNLTIVCRQRRRNLSGDAAHG